VTITYDPTDFGEIRRKEKNKGRRQRERVDSVESESTLWWRDEGIEEWSDAQ
jgi:hypothetical protein